MIQGHGTQTIFGTIIGWRPKSLFRRCYAMPDGHLSYTEKRRNNIQISKTVLCCTKIVFSRQSLWVAFFVSEVFWLSFNGTYAGVTSIYWSITFASNGKSLTGLWFDGQKYFGDTLPHEYQEKNLPVFDETSAWLDIYFSGKNPDFTPSLSFNTSPFRKMVWEILLTIPYRKTMTYGEIAGKITE